MRKIKEILWLRLTCNLSLDAIARALSLSKGVVAKYVRGAEQANLSWGEACALDEAALPDRLIAKPAAPAERASQFTPPDYAWIHQELKRKSVTLQLLWEEYREQCAGRPYGYTSFCVHYRAWAKTLKRSMRQLHRAGEKLFVDYAGQTMAVVDPRSGEIRQAQLFVAVLGASNYTFALATATQTTADWIGAHNAALAYIGGCPELIVPDNARALIANPDRYEPHLGRVYAEFASHYGCAVLPARPRKPQDKVSIDDAALSWARKQDSLASEAALDGLYIVRTSVPATQMEAPECVRNYKLLANVERAFRSLKTIDLKVRPIHHRKADRVRAHIFLCMLAYYVEWHLREAWRELMFADTEQQAKATRDPVAPAQRSASAQAKAATHCLIDGTPAHSFATLMAELANLVRNTCRTPNAGPNAPTFEITTNPEPWHERALALVQMIRP